MNQHDAIIHVLRCFDDNNIVHVENTIDPVRDKEIIDLELQLKDLETLEKRKEKISRLIKTGNKEAAFQNDVLAKMIDHLQLFKPVRSIEFSKKEKEFSNTLAISVALVFINLVRGYSSVDIMVFKKSSTALALSSLIPEYTR